MAYAVSPTNPIGHLPLGFNTFQIPTTTEVLRSGLIVQASDPYWGGAEFMFARAAGTIDVFAPVMFTPSLTSGVLQHNATEVSNTANLGKPAGVAMQAMVSGDFGWFMISGLTPVASSASVAADTALGITGAGTLGAIAAGKQLVSARVAQPATTTVVKAAQARSGATQLRVNGFDGWFVGAYLSGTGIAAATAITSLDPDGVTVTVNNATTAAVAGNVTATYNNASIFYNVVHLNRPFYQGAIT